VEFKGEEFWSSGVSGVQTIDCTLEISRKQEQRN
jgi:hypothetical protein